MNPDTSSKQSLETILYKLDGDIQNAVEVFIQQDPTWNKFVETFSEVCKDTIVVKKPVGAPIPRRIAYQSKPFNRDSRTPVATTTTE